MYRYYDNLFRHVNRQTPLDYFLAKDVPEARRMLKRQDVDLIILDWNLPQVSGLDFLKEIRSEPGYKDLLIIMVTSKGSAKDCAEALNAGADDFLPKPFAPEVLLARLRSLARRKGRPWQKEAPIERGGIRLDPSRCQVKIAGREVILHPKELTLLEIFLKHPGIVHPARELWDRGWASESDNWEHILVATISNLKKRLGLKLGGRLQCRRSLGYVFDP
jgi:two-component system phosphate regulon response regulator PhoB